MAKARPIQFDRSDEAIERYRKNLETHRDSRTRYTARACPKATTRVIAKAIEVLPAVVPWLGIHDRETLIEDIGWQTIRECRGHDLAIGFLLDHVSWTRVQWEHERAIYEIGRYIGEIYVRAAEERLAAIRPEKRPRAKPSPARSSTALCVAQAGPCFVDLVACGTIDLANWVSDCLPDRSVVAQFLA